MNYGMRPKALFLVNTRARRGQEDLAMIRERLSGELDLIEPRPDSGDFSSVILEHASEVSRVIIGGGDGTLNHALRGLLEAQMPLGVLPLGTANDLARTLGLPSDPLEACDVILANYSQRIDIGQVNDRPYFNVASIGLGAEVTRRLSKGTKTYWGVFAYVWAAMGAMIGGRPFRVEITGNGQTLKTRSWQVAVGNGRNYGGGMTIHENARIDDGQLDLYSLEIKRSWQILPLIPALWRGTLDPVLPVRTMHGTAFDVRPVSHPRSIIADGELIGKTPAVFRLFPKALSVYVPQPER